MKCENTDCQNKTFGLDFGKTNAMNDDFSFGNPPPAADMQANGNIVPN